MIDYHTLAEVINEDLKTIYLYEGDSINVNLYIQSEKEIELSKLKGNLKINEPNIIKTDANRNFKSFIGNYWDVKQTTLFRAEKYDSIPQVVKFSVSFNRNYPFDKFYYQINIISNDSSFHSIEGSLDVNKEGVLALKDQDFDLSQEIKVVQPGKYIIEIVPLMGIQKINGLRSVGYQLVNITD